MIDIQKFDHITMGIEVLEALAAQLCAVCEYAEKEESMEIRKAAYDLVEEIFPDVKIVMKSNKRKGKIAKKEFMLSKEEAEKVILYQRCMIGTLYQAINAARNTETTKALTYTMINQFLEEEGFIRYEEVDGSKRKVATPMGIAQGMRQEERTGRTGEIFNAITYPRAIQKKILDHWTEKTGEELPEVSV